MILEIHESLCNEVKQSLDFDIESRDARIVALEKEMEQLKAEKMTAIHGDLQDVRGSMDDLEQYSRRNCLIFSGVEEKRGENTTEVIRSLCRQNLGVEVNVADVDRIHRLGPARPNGEPPENDRRPSTSRATTKARNIIVKFSNYGARERIYSARKRLKDSPAIIRVYINENLTKIRSKLLWKIRKATKNTEHRVWTQDGVIIVNKPGGGRIKVTRESHFARLSELNFHE